MHHERDLLDYLWLAVEMGVIGPDDVQALLDSTRFIPGGCELGIYPTRWLSTTLKKLEVLGREYVTRFGDRIRTYDSYQVRAVGFLAERLGSYFLLQELRNRYPQGIPSSLFGNLCVIVNDGETYAGASVKREPASLRQPSDSLGKPPARSVPPETPDHDGTGVVAATPQDLDALIRTAVRLFDEQKWQECLRHFGHIAALKPNDAQIQNYRARAFESLDRHEEALHCLDLALAINPDNVAALRNRAIILTKLGRLGDAAAAYDTVLRLRPDDPDLLVRRATVRNQIDRRAEAITDVDRAVALRPDDSDILNSRVIILDNLGRYTDALTDLDRMLSLRPNHLDAINNCGMVLARLGKFKESLTCYNRSLSLKPDQPQAIYNRSLIRLSLGDWIRGFQEFESRWNTPPLNKTRLTGLGPLWLGGEEDLVSKTLLLYHEQGYGDTLQCARYVPLLAERGAKVIVAVPPGLGSLMRSLPGVTAVVADGPLPPHDYQCPFMSLPLAFRTTPDTIPAPVPYLAPNSAKVADWAARLGPRLKLRIGIAWGGRRYAPINYPRDIALAALKPLLLLDADFISLQKDMADSDRATLDQFPQLRRLGEALGDFEDTAALMMNLDLIITVDTAVGHLAGALGRPVWLLNRIGACWRWLQEGATSPWYPTLRQFRQSVVGDWTSVVVDVRQALHSLLNEFTKASAPTAASVVSHRLITPGPVSHPKKAPKQKIRLVSATRLSHSEFFKTAPLGRSLPVYWTFPKRQAIELRLFADNREGLSTVYNTAIEEAKSDPAILIFIHDDVYLSDYYWAEHLHHALEHFDLVGLAGNKRRVPRQASWMFLDGQFTRDTYDNLSGVLGHGDPFPNLKQLSVYGEPGQEVKLLDGVMMAIRSEVLIERDLRFDPRFTFDFYDLDFCRQAELRQIRMGTWAISVVHASAGALGVDSWRAAYGDYLAKYGEN
jgi:tetratricopeptide (TPR) repeat protein